MSGMASRAGSDSHRPVTGSFHRLMAKGASSGVKPRSARRGVSMVSIFILHPLPFNVWVQIQVSASSPSSRAMRKAACFTLPQPWALMPAL